MSVKFIHAADLHIDSPMRGLARKDGAVAESVRGATRSAFKNLVRTAIAEKVDFVIIAGDLFDGRWDDRETGVWTSKEFGKLAENGIPVYLSFGNHDGANPIIKNMRERLFGDDVKVFSTKRPERFLFEKDGERIAIVGQSYPEAKCVKNLASNYPEPERDAYNIGVLHTGLEGGSGETIVYAPTSVAELQRKGYQYWALGHQHKREIFDASLDSFIAYSGSTQARHINESENSDGTHSKGFFLAEVENGRLKGLPRFVASDAYRWYTARLDLEQVEGESEPRDALCSLFRAKAAELLAESENRGVAARVVLSGRTSLYRRLEEEREDVSEGTIYNELRASLGTLEERFKIESFDIDEARAPIPADFWDRGALKSLKERLDARGEAFAQNARANVAAEAPELEELGKTLGKYRKEFLSERVVDWTDARNLAKWNQRAIDALADALLRAANE